MLKKFARNAARRIFTTSTRNPDTVKIAEIKLDGTEDVYNMEVPGTHNFAINGGLIVHNCMDALRYFVQTRRIYRNEGRYVSPFEQKR